MKSLIGGMVIGIAGAGVVLADVDAAQATACFDRAMINATDPAACIDAAQASCLDSAQETPAVAALCFQTARTAWSDALGATLSRIGEEAESGVAQVARIETKYDLLTNLLQCDRLRELSGAVGPGDENARAVQGARCQATAPALSFMRLYLRGRPQKNGVTP